MPEILRRLKRALERGGWRLPFGIINVFLLNPLKKTYSCKIIHCLGDSHTDYIKHVSHFRFWRATRFEFCMVSGATAMGILNPHSKTDAFNILSKYLENVKSTDFIFLSFGEIDCSFVIWYRATKYQISVTEQFNTSLNNYFEFVNQLLAKGKRNVIISSVPLPTIREGQDWKGIAHARREVKASLQERTELTIRYNEKLREFCRNNNLYFLDFEKEILDPQTGVVKKEFLTGDPFDNHLLSRRVSPILAKKLSDYGFK